MKKLVIIVPALNEAASIKETISGLSRVAERLSHDGVETHILVVDDGSDDGTADQATAAGAHQIVRHSVNHGLGAAVRSGLRAARDAQADIVVKFDADLQHDPDDIAAMIQPILQDDADIVYGYRFERIAYRMPFVRRAGNLVFTGLMRWLTGWPIRDSQPGIFAAGRAYLQDFRLPGDYNYTQQILLDAYHKRMRFAHVSVAFNERTTGSSFVNLRYPFRVLYQIFLCLIGVKPMKVFGSIGILFLGMAFLVSSIDLFDFFFFSSDKPIQKVNFVLGSSLFGIQCMFFGALAQLIIERR